MLKRRVSVLVLVVAVFCPLAFGQMSSPSGDAMNNLLEKARIQVALKNYPAALTLLQEASRLDPRNAAVANLTGVVCLQQKDFTGAGAYFKKAVKLDPTDCHAYNNMGTLCHITKDYQGAIKWYGKALEKDPAYLTCRFNLANTYFTTNQFNLGVEAMQKIFQADPDFFSRKHEGALVGISSIKLADQYYCIAKLYIQSGNQEKALQFLEKSIAAGFDNLQKVRNDKDFEPMKDNTRFQALVGIQAKA